MRRAPPALCLSLFLASGDALANGRFPLANQLLVDPADASHIAVRTTFGMLVSGDATTFRWLCEAGIGYGGNQDPGIGIFGNGAIAVAAFEGFPISQDGGCNFAFAGGDLEPQYVVDPAVEPGSPLRGVAVTSVKVKA